MDAIGIFDSGVGGLSVWREVARRFPTQNLIYFADQAHVPYGARPISQIRRYATGVTRFLLEQGAGVIVVACNTASAAALYPLRAAFPSLPFVGMEPAVKPAAENSRSGVVGVIATPATFQGQLFASLVARFASHVQVLEQVCPGLVDAVETGDLDSPATKTLLRDYLSPLIASGMDTLVLGCTHYPFLRPAIADVVGSGVRIIDPAPAVARQVGRVLDGLERTGGNPPSGKRVFYTSGAPDAFSAVAVSLLGQSGPINVRPAVWRADRLVAT